MILLIRRFVYVESYLGRNEFPSLMLFPVNWVVQFYVRSVSSLRYSLRSFKLLNLFG